MATWSKTAASIQASIEALVRRLSKNATITALEKATIGDAINMCIIDVSTDRSGVIKSITAETTASTTAGTNYVDLSSDVIYIVDGTVRIEAEDRTLHPITLEQFWSLDPGEDATEIPSFYAIGANGNVIRMYLRDTPDSVYTIALTVATIPDDDSISTFPNWMHGLLLAGSTAQTLEMLGFNGATYQQRFEDKLLNARAMQKGRSGAQHIKGRSTAMRYIHPEMRLP